METFVALRAEIDSWRWADVPFYIRAGKRLATTATAVLVEFKQPPRLFFARSDAPQPHPTHLKFRMKPGERVSLSVQIEPTGRELVSRSVDLAYTYDESTRRHPHRRLARLLDDALKAISACSPVTTSSRRPGGSSTPCSTTPPPLCSYQPRSWGPARPTR